MLVSGSSGLIGSQVVESLAARFDRVVGLDNNMRASFFGPAGDTRWNQRRLQESIANFRHVELDVRDREGIRRIVAESRPALIVHAAAQPSHDLASVRVFEDFDTNAVGTLNLLEAARFESPEAVFVHLSSNKVYGDAPNRLPLRELEKRWDYDEAHWNGINEEFPIDQSMHSLFGVSKSASDLLVQEYGRYFGMKTCCLRAGCLTGPNHSGVELHGFLSYLIKCNVLGHVYKVFGYKGKQVRDNIHAADVASFIAAFFERPRSAAVYNIGGGRSNSISLLEAFERIESISGTPMKHEYQEKNREGDHICYISDLSKIRADYPQWSISRSMDDIFLEIFRSWKDRAKSRSA